MRRKDRRSAVLEKALVAGALVLSAYALRSGLQATYRSVTGHQAPQNPARPDVGWKRALLWSTATGALLGAAKTALRPQLDRGVRKLLSD